MKQKGLVSILGLAVVAGAAIYIGRAFLKPASEQAQASSGVLSGAYDARVETCAILEDHELPEGLKRPDIGSSDRYVQLIVLFPQAAKISGKKDEYHLDRINGSLSEPIGPAYCEMATEEDGIVLTLTYATNEDFVTARLVRGEEVIVKQVALE